MTESEGKNTANLNLLKQLDQFSIVLEKPTTIKLQYRPSVFISYAMLIPMLVFIIRQIVLHIVGTT